MDGASGRRAAGCSGPQRWAAPDLNHRWMVRDFTHGGGPASTADDEAGFDPAPLVPALGTWHDLPVAHLRAGQALQRVLLTVTVLGLSASVLSAPVEVGATRSRLTRSIRQGLYPQILVRVGHGDGTPVETPRLDPRQLWG
ncbi:MAG: hypothetical protein QOG20_5182 [Pseudonocardiales bacterium]|nr:hypothetical protein [Pseudonocardiales bacterium]